MFKNKRRLPPPFLLNLSPARSFPLLLVRLAAIDTLLYLPSAIVASTAPCPSPLTHHLDVCALCWLISNLAKQFAVSFAEDRLGSSEKRWKKYSKIYKSGEKIPF